MKRDFFFFNFIVFAWLFVSSCTPIKNSRYSEYLASKSEASSCDTSYTYASTTTLTGTAKFFKRGVNIVVQDETIYNMTLGDPLSSALPIQSAEVIVYNSGNQIVQCGITDSSGNIKAIDGSSSLVIPATSDTYTVRVFSRVKKTLTYAGKSSFVMNIAVKKDLYTNELYNISANVVSNGLDDTNVALIAYARQTDSLEIEGGAFNILNSIGTAYNYIRANTGTVNTTCLSDRLNIYWKAGFNPNQYYEPDSDPSQISNTSFYDHKTSNLFITGGRLGDISLDVTHHFDDTVIIHELGHHVENKCGQLLNPGGIHYLFYRLDPRLAWSEGWANYFATHILFNSINSVNPEFTLKASNAGVASPTWTYLFGSQGFSDSLQNVGNGSSNIFFDLSKAGNNPNLHLSGVGFGRPYDQIDATKYFGEGHYREAAVSRGLFKLSNSCGNYCIPSSPISFQNMWKSMDKLTGIGQPSFAYRGSASYLETLKGLIGSTTWNTTYKSFNEASTTEALHLFSDGKFTSGSGASASHTWVPYGTRLNSVTSSACSSGTFNIEPRIDDPVLTASNSDQRYSNHYFTIDLTTLTSLSELSVTFTKAYSGGTTTEFDILLFDQDYAFNEDTACSTPLQSNGVCSGGSVSTRTTTSNTIKSDRRSGATITTKTIRGLNLLDSSKPYLLNIRAYTPGKSINSSTIYKYEIKDQDGNYICP